MSGANFNHYCCYNNVCVNRNANSNRHYNRDEQSQLNMVDDGVNFNVGIWEKCNASGPYPSNMVRAGRDCRGEEIYVGRAFHSGDLLPAKVIPINKKAYVSFAGEEFTKNHFEVLRYGTYVWEFASNGEVPKTALKVGQTANGEALYMGRATYRNTLTPGKVHPSNGCCYLPYGSKEIKVFGYEVLCVIGQTSERKMK